MRSFLFLCLLATTLQASPVPPGPLPDPSGKAFLGVKPKRWNFIPPEPKSLIVEEVVPGSPADKFGLQAEDAVLTVNGQKVPNLYELVNILSYYRPGAEVTVVVEREVAGVPVTMSIPVKLGLYKKEYEE